MGGTDNRHTSILQAFCITPLLGVRKRIPHIGKVLMTVTANQLMIGFAIKPKAAVGSLTISSATELCLTNTGTYHTTIHTCLTLHYHDFHLIQVRIFRTP